jgi:tRNA(Ile)-lysidine synthase
LPQVKIDAPATDFAAAMRQGIDQGAPWPGAVAVSGGGDSLALMLLLADWASACAHPLPIVLTVDHGLQNGSTRVARHVASLAKKSGLSAHVLVWRGVKPEADIEAQARIARYSLMGGWCAKHRIQGLYVGHTMEDQAETFVLRLARGSGLDGLAAMRPFAPFPVPGFAGLQVLRPLLGFARETLRSYLRGRDVEWFDDPMNSDTRFARVRVRRAWPALNELGLSAARVAAASRHLARARDALEDATRRFLDEACRFETEEVVLDGLRFRTVAPEIGLRALTHVLSHVSGEAYRPRFERLERLFALIRDGGPKSARTLHGCRIGRSPKGSTAFGPHSLVVTREKGRVHRRNKDTAEIDAD